MLFIGYSEYGYDDDQGSDIFGRGSAMSTPLHPSAKRHPLDDEDDYQTPGQSARSRNKRPKRESSLNRSTGQQRLVLKTKSEQSPDAVSPAPPSTGQPILSRFITEPSLSQQPSARRPRPLTQHQLAVEQYRRQRIEYLLSKRKNDAYRVFRAKRESEIPFGRSGRLLQGVPDGYDTEDEENSWGKGGVLPNPDEEEDFGECASYFLSVIRKATRRLDRWDYENANGPKRNRRQEREERHRARMDVFSFDDSLDIGGGRTSTSARNKARAARNAKRRAETAAGPKVEAAAASHATGDHRSRGAATAADSAKAGAEAPKGGDDGLDDIDRELLGEGSGDEDEDEDQHVSRPPGPGFEDSYIGEALSSDDSDEEDDDEGEGEGDADVHAGGEGHDNSSTYEGGENENSSVAGGGDLEAEAGAATGGSGGEQGPGATAGEDGVMGHP
jgi:Ino eighty subunit 1